MHVDLSLLIASRDLEADLPRLVKQLLVVGQVARAPGREPGELAFEILALDERSRDNSLSVLAMLQTQIAQLAVFDDIPPGTAIREGVAKSRGRTLLIVDSCVDPEYGVWECEAVLGGQVAATVPGELLAVDRDLAHRALRRLTGGLMRGQRAVRKTLEETGRSPAFAPANVHGLRARTRRWLRSRASLLPITARAFDRAGRS